MKKELCDNLLSLNDDARNEPNWPKSNADIATAFYCVECLRTSGNDLASELLHQISISDFGKNEDVKNAIERHKRKLDSGDIDFMAAQEVSHVSPISQPVSLKSPPLMVRGINFASAMARWAMRGFKTRTQEEIDERLAICQGCEFYQNETCTKCGCACNESGWINKIALATESCPEKKW